MILIKHLYLYKIFLRKSDENDLNQSAKKTDLCCPAYNHCLSLLVVENKFESIEKNKFVL